MFLCVTLTFPSLRFIFWYFTKTCPLERMSFYPFLLNIWLTSKLWITRTIAFKARLYAFFTSYLKLDYSFESIIIPLKASFPWIMASSKENNIFPATYDDFVFYSATSSIIITLPMPILFDLIWSDLCLYFHQIRDVKVEHLFPLQFVFLNFFIFLHSFLLLYIFLIVTYLICRDLRPVFWSTSLSFTFFKNCKYWRIFVDI